VEVVVMKIFSIIEASRKIIDLKVGIGKK
jgi:hypothetical protein